MPNRTESGLRTGRRPFLYGAGITVGLPFFESFRAGRLKAGDAKAPVKPPTRMAYLYFPNGVFPANWEPKGSGKNFEFSSSLMPLKSLKDDILVLSQLWNSAADTGDGHYVKSAGWLTGTTIHKTSGSDIRSNGISVDQLAAQQLGNLTRLPSLELGTEPTLTAVDLAVGYTRLYGAHISWRSPIMPIAKEINPQGAFDRLFQANQARSKGDLKDDQSILDLVREDANEVRRKIGADDQRKLDEYMDSIRSIEKRIAFELTRDGSPIEKEPAFVNAVKSLGTRIKERTEELKKRRDRDADHSEHVRLMLDLMVLAFWSDTTRISTFMFANDVSNRNFSFLPGVKEAHHESSHHENRKEKVESFSIINRWHVEQFAYLLSQLKSKQEAGGNLLDQSMILFGSPIRDGNAHDPHNLPLVLGGKAGGSIKTGRHIVFPKDTPLCNLYVSMLNRFGVPTDKFANSTGSLKELAEG